jgi:TonB family protein
MTIVTQVFFACLLLGAESGAQQVTPLLVSAWTSESVLRTNAVTVIRPEYPPKAIRMHRSGVAVVQVRLSTTGTVREATVLEAPCGPIADSIVTAVMQWKFKPFWSVPANISGKLTFYFAVQNRHPAVLYPSEAPYLGLQHNPSSESRVASAPTR